MILEPYNGYMDETEQSICPEEAGSDQIFGISGYVNTYDGWIEFGKVWQPFLESKGIKVFHMTDFLARNPPYDWDDHIRDNFIGELTSIAEKKAGIGVGCVIRKSQYADIILPRIPTKDWERDAYYFCAWGCFVQLLDWQDTIEFEKPFRFLFENRDKVKGGTKQLYDYIRDNIKGGNLFGEIAFGPKDQNYPGLQAADLIAYSAGRDLVDQAKGKPMMFKPLEKLAKRKRLLITYPTKDNLEKFIEFAKMVGAVSGDDLTFT